MIAIGAQSQRSSLANLVRPGYVGPVWCDGHEVLRRIFVTVRDRRWGEVAPTRWETDADEAAGSVRFNARHISDEVDFEWQGALTVSRDGRALRFSFEGKALRDMELCRVGLVVLHPVDSMVDSRLSMLSPQGEQSLTVPRWISPQPVLNGIPQAMTEPFSELLIEREDFGRLGLEFTGDLFELEDQRNWGDASFKTYCTPLRLGFPRRINAGATISQSVKARFAPEVLPKSSNTSLIEKVTPAAASPTIGCERDPVALLRDPGSSEVFWHHVRFQVARDEDLASIQSVLEALPSIKIELQVDLEPQEFPGELVLFLHRFHGRVLRLLVCGSGGSLPSSRAIDRLRRMVEGFGALSFPMLAATRGYFVEFNRTAAFSAPVSGIAFPLSPTVHSDDAETIAQNVTAITDIAETAQHLTGLQQVVISPLALRYPWAGKPWNFPEALARSWIAAIVGQAALAGITSLTLGADLMAMLDVERLDTRRILSSLLGCTGLKVAPLGMPLPANVHAFRFGPDVRPGGRILIANLNSQAVRVSFPRDGISTVRGTDAATGAPLTITEGKLVIPQFGTTWIDLESGRDAQMASVGTRTHR